MDLVSENLWSKHTNRWLIVSLILTLTPLNVEAKAKGKVGGDGGGGSKAFDAMKSQMGAIVNRPMTRDEAYKILGIEAEIDDELDHKQIMERFDTLFAKNLPEKGGSFYI